MSVIRLEHITKDYGHGKGVFDVSFTVEKGEVMGFLGPNGAGKTTTIRQLLGFTKPNAGSASIYGLNCFDKASDICRNLGYLPGEIAFMDDMKGMEFIRFVAAMQGISNLSRAKELLAFFELDPSGRIKKMSKGMKQKIGIVCAFMGDADTYILDEPTSGLDPLMQNRFVEWIQKEKAAGKTILMSSHMFEEVEKTCDRVAIIREGRIVSVEAMAALQSARRKVFDITFALADDAHKAAAQNGWQANGAIATARVKDVNALIEALRAYPIADIATRTQSLEDLFMHFYGGEAK